MLWRARIETLGRAWMPDFRNLLVSHAPWIIALAVAIDQLGIPIPSMPTLLLAGSLIGRIDVDTLSGLLEGEEPPIVYDLRDRLASRHSRDACPARG